MSRCFMAGAFLMTHAGAFAQADTQIIGRVLQATSPTILCLEPEQAADRSIPKRMLAASNAASRDPSMESRPTGLVQGATSYTVRWG